MIFSFVSRHLSLKISLLLVPLFLIGLASFSWFLIDNRAAIVEQENFNKAKAAALVGAEGMSTFLEDLVVSGVFTKEQIFDRNYRRIESGDLSLTKIPKYSTVYDRYLEGRIIHFEDAFLVDKSIVYAVLVDTNGYLPVHNSRYSRPLTGDDDKDRVANRTKRIFDDPVGLKAARFEASDDQPVLRQIYHRDTGNVMWDVTAPVTVYDRHWGGFRIGLSMERAETEIQRLKKTILIASSGFGLLTLLFMVTIIGRATVPLKRLTRTADAIAKGQRQEPIDIHSQDEIGALERSFNQMQSTLENTTVSRDYFDRIFNSVHDLLMVISPSGELLQINRAAKETFGVEEGQVLGRQIHKFYSGKSGEDDWYERLSRQHRLEAEDVFLPQENGEKLALSLSASPLYGEHNQIDGYVIVCQDNNRRIRAGKEMEVAFDNAFAFNAELREMNDSIERKNLELDEAYQKLKSSQSQILQQEKMASIGQLAAGVAHEINNPMGFITSNLQTMGKYLDRLKLFVDDQKLLLSQKLNADELQPHQAQQKKLKIDYIFEDGRDLLEESLDGAERVKAIVQNLKSFSRVDQAAVSEINLNDCLESTIDIAWNELKYKITLEKELGELDRLRCHPQQLNQVFLNILVNAAHAIERQGILRIKTWQDDRNQYVAISDDGCGISKENQQKIFEPFFTTKEVGKGTGLGMSISYDIIKKHQGEIKLESELGVGTTFTLIFPREGVKDQEGNE